MSFPKKPSHPPSPPSVPANSSNRTSVVPLSVKPPSNIKDAKTEAYAITGGGLTRSAAPAPMVGKKTVLIVDNDAEHRASLKRQLEMFYNVVEAKDGMEAVEIAPTIPNLALVVSEVVMPRVDGFTLAKIIRGHPTLKRVPIMFVSARNEPRDVTQALVLGVAHYFKKPTPATTILEKIRKVVV